MRVDGKLAKVVGILSKHHEQMQKEIKEIGADTDYFVDMIVVTDQHDVAQLLSRIEFGRQGPDEHEIIVVDDDTTRDLVTSLLKVR
jgi:hypothetical protein